MEEREAKASNPRRLADRYEVGRLLGAGGMAEVFEGRDRLLARRVAIKVLQAQFARDPAFLTRLKREAQAAASLSHPNIVGVYDTGSEDGTHFIVMEYVDGRTVKDVIRAEGPLYPERAAEICADVCNALTAAHARGLIHRDIKPGNVMLTPEGKVKVMDFGIARATTSETITQTAAVVGTAQYISPEQAQGQAVDFRSDLYSTGCCLYEMLTGTVPFTGATPVAIAYRHVREDPTPPRQLNRDVPVPLEAICLKAMAKLPDNRYQTAAEFHADLERFRNGQPVLATPLLDGAATTQALPRGDGGADPTAMLGGPVAADRATRYAEPEELSGHRRWLPRIPRLRLHLRRARRSRSAGGPGQASPGSGESVSFTAAYPGVATPAVWYSLSVYVHLGRLQAEVDELIARRSPQLGLRPAVSRAAAFTPLPKGVPLRITPEVEGVALNPPFQEVTWLENLQEVNFRLRATAEAAGRALLGAIEVHAGPLLVAHVPLSIRVRGVGEREEVDDISTATAHLFNRVFASYAHEDDHIVRAFAEAYRALGIDVLVDKASLRAGERWQETLRRLIEDADLFQLFWSAASSRSPDVADEWRHALLLQDRKGERFIRPMYWERPLPPPPPPLAHLHFANLDLAVLSSVARADRVL
jgi:predicted Ser/Thr protein kinase